MDFGTGYGPVAVHAHAWDQGARTTPEAYFGPHATLGAFVAATPGLFAPGELRRRGVVDVCYGGTFAVARDNLMRRGRAAYAALAAALQRGDNIAEGSMVERLWAPLLARPRPRADRVAQLCAARRHFARPHSYAGMLVGCRCDGEGGGDLRSCGGRHAGLGR